MFVRYAHNDFSFSALLKQAGQGFKAKMPANADICFLSGEGGIRTLDTSLSSYNGLANRPFRPLRHLSNIFPHVLIRQPSTVNPYSGMQK
jgi:hypothetical protein